MNVERSGRGLALDQSVERNGHLLSKEGAVTKDKTSTRRVRGEKSGFCRIPLKIPFALLGH